MRTVFWILSLSLILTFCREKSTSVYQSESLIIEQLSEHTYQHMTYLQTNDYGKVACNGMIVMDGKEAVVFDTPSDTATSAELIDWIEKTQDVRLTAVVPTHFHQDCLGGLAMFHARQIPSTAHNKTIQLLDSTAVLPWQGFDDFTHLTVGSLEVKVDFVGEGHTQDNVVAYVAADKVLFGGCLIKKMNASKGYLGDANVAAWSATVETVKQRYNEVQMVIPGHGPAGGTDLLDYTIEMFADQ